MGQGPEDRQVPPSLIGPQMVDEAAPGTPPSANVENFGGQQTADGTDFNMSIPISSVILQPWATEVINEMKHFKSLATEKIREIYELFQPSTLEVRFSASPNTSVVPCRREAKLKLVLASLLCCIYIQYS